MIGWAWALAAKTSATAATAIVSVVRMIGFSPSSFAMLQFLQDQRYALTRILGEAQDALESVKASLDWIREREFPAVAGDT